MRYKNIVSLLVIFLFLLLAVGSTDESSDPTDTENIRECNPLVFPWTYSPKVCVQIYNKITGEHDIGGNVEIRISYYEFQYEPIGCEGYLKVIYTNSSEHTIGETGVVCQDYPAFVFSEDSELIEIEVKCQASQYYNFQTATKERIISAKYSTDDELVGIPFAFFSNDDL